MTRDPNSLFVMGSRAQAMAIHLLNLRSHANTPRTMKITAPPPEEPMKFLDLGPKRRGKHHGKNPGAFGRPCRS